MKKINIELSEVECKVLIKILTITPSYSYFLSKKEIDVYLKLLNKFCKLNNHNIENTKKIGCDCEFCKIIG